ncbi:hypothetical protein [Pseudoalteromonas luteoviolacea]|uniref:Lipoprotein n=1 Tax=Pseudoalteromonas luteoviolacea S4060-1 TaxID=1365257 RepID=A0A167N6D6_9GAMM|nr:hypothetical protein [Pseudoalteromonas luteoviolacea]KZN28668.1 hypothetical protein N480_11285 [Pseudoalteromonas luteoviolacea S2607]KZN67574.1 hypothetical protein N478_02125 [Pseudoalteromonas luteoviolacea S4060-1]
MRIFTLTALILCVLSGCIFVPKEVQYFDEQCQITKRKHVLSQEEMGHLGGCSDKACAVLMAGAGFVSAASLVVSGTIVITHNTLTWLEQRGDCGNS